MGVSGSRPSPAERWGPCLPAGGGEPAAAAASEARRELAASWQGDPSEGACVLASRRAAPVCEPEGEDLSPGSLGRPSVNGVSLGESEWACRETGEGGGPAPGPRDAVSRGAREPLGPF